MKCNNCGYNPYKGYTVKVSPEFIKRIEEIVELEKYADLITKAELKEINEGIQNERC